MSCSRNLQSSTMRLTSKELDVLNNVWVTKVLWDNRKFIHRIDENFYDFCNLYEINVKRRSITELKRERLHIKFLEETERLFTIYEYVIKKFKKLYGDVLTKNMYKFRYEAYQYLVSKYIPLISVYI